MRILHTDLTGPAGELHLLTALPDADTSPAALYDGLMRHVADAGLETLQERIYGAVAHHDEIAAARSAALAATGRPGDDPATFVGCAPYAQPVLGGVEIVGWRADGAPTPDAVRLVRDPSGAAVGKRLDVPALRALFLANATSDGRSEAVEDLRGMLERAFARVREAGFSSAQVARTWLYLEDLLDDYAALNEARDGVFAAERIGVSSGGAPPPASTGIQGRHPDRARAFVDVAAFASDSGPAFAPLRAVAQCEAWDYGSAFSRGMAVPWGDAQLLYLSGTASIDRAGRTVHVADPTGQVRQTLEAAAEALAPSGGSLDRLASAVLFFKNDETHAAWCDLEARGEIPRIPAIAVRADVCRPELLVELEATAIAPP